MKPHLFFLHGFPFNHTAWAAQIKEFQKDYHVMAPDLRGHGEGIKPPGPWMIQHFVEDLKKQLDGSKIDKINLCGLSMGGYIALHFARKYPQHIQSLILCDTRPDGDSNEAKDKRFATMLAIDEKGVEAFAEDFSKNVLSPSTLKEQPELQLQVKKMITGNDPESIKRTLGVLASRQDSQGDLAQLSFPCLVVVGEADKVTPVDVNKKMAEQIPQARFEIIPKAGHFSNLENPEAFNKIMREFLKAHAIV